MAYPRSQQPAHCHVIVQFGEFKNYKNDRDFNKIFVLAWLSTVRMTNAANRKSGVTKRYLRISSASVRASSGSELVRRTACWPCTLEWKTPTSQKSHVNDSELLHLARAGIIFKCTVLLFGAYFLQSSGFRLSSFISDIFGASGRNIILHLIEHGQIDRTALDFCLMNITVQMVLPQLSVFEFSNISKFCL